MPNSASPWSERDEPFHSQDLMADRDVPATGQALAGLSILIVEDEYIVASMLAAHFTRAGILVVGPVGSIEAALGVLSQTPVDAAVLDLDLRGRKAYDVADRLKELQIPFVLATGYDDHTVPARFAAVARCRKPALAQTVLDALSAIVRPGAE